MKCRAVPPPYVPQSVPGLFPRRGRGWAADFATGAGPLSAGFRGRRGLLVASGGRKVKTEIELCLALAAADELGPVDQPAVVASSRTKTDLMV